MTDTTDTTLRKVPATAPVEEILSVFRKDGGVIIEGLLTADQIERFNAEIEPKLRAMAPGGKHSDELVAEFHGANTKRLTNMITLSETYRTKIVDHDLVHALCDAIFLEESGTYWMTSSQLIEIGPGNRAQFLHRDLESWPPFVTLGPSGPEAVANFLIALTDFTEENGATRVIPGSNHWEDFTDRGEPEQTIPAVMNAGDALLFSGKTVHGGGANVTSDQYRRGLAFAMSPGYLVGEEAFPLMVDLELVKTLPERIQRLLGFRSQYPIGSPGIWTVDVADVADYLGL
ncbi:phytanoyl-CoA dioxygenase family protein [Rhodococcus daqingensis]|uniref:Phytanoyl-CoA dioxygenase family protein n=1 Tax=Rhodococcus daqingensis TaxID=2479363 RepID=A0ABW2RUQ1_9NOCA